MLQKAYTQLLENDGVVCVVLSEPHLAGRPSSLYCCGQLFERDDAVALGAKKPAFSYLLTESSQVIFIFLSFCFDKYYYFHTFHFYYFLYYW